MSYVSTYDRRTPKPKDIALAIGVHAVIIAMVIAMPGVEFIPDEKKKEVKAIFISKFVPPEKKPEEKKPEIQLPREQKVQRPVQPFDDLPKAPGTEISSVIGSEEISLGGVGNGIDIPLDPLEKIKPAPDPIVIDAKLDPRFTRQFQPRYPSGLLRLDVEGEVSVRVLVGANGKVKDIQLIDSPHPEFWESTRRHALRKWRFNPATKDGVPVESWIRLRVQFQIN